MIELITLLMACLLGYAFLRSYGGEGAAIKVKFAPASTPEGRKDRIKALAVCVVIFSTVGFVAMRQDANPWAYFGINLLIGMLVVAVSQLKNRK